MKTPTGHRQTQVPALLVRDQKVRKELKEWAVDYSQKTKQASYQSKGRANQEGKFHTQRLYDKVVVESILEVGTVEAAPWLNAKTSDILGK